MKASIAPGAGPGDTIEIETEEGDRLPFILAQVSLPYVRQRLDAVQVDSVPIVHNEDLPAWLRREGEDDGPPVDDGQDAERWTHVLEEVVWSLEMTVGGMQEMRRHVITPGEYDIAGVADQDGSRALTRRKAGVLDMEGIRTDVERQRNGMRLFARYLQAI